MLTWSCSLPLLIAKTSSAWSSILAPGPPWRRRRSAVRCRSRPAAGRRARSVEVAGGEFSRALNGRCRRNAVSVATGYAAGPSHLFRPGLRARVTPTDSPIEATLRNGLPSARPTSTSTTLPSARSRSASSTPGQVEGAREVVGGAQRQYAQRGSCSACRPASIPGQPRSCRRHRRRPRLRGPAPAPRRAPAGAPRGRSTARLDPQVDTQAQQGGAGGVEAPGAGPGGGVHDERGGGTCLDRRHSG